MENFTEREREVLFLLLRGLNNKEISKRLEIIEKIEKEEKQPIKSLFTIRKDED